MKFRFQSFVDIQTSASSMQVLQWSVGGADVVNRCRHLFGAYKYFKLGKISVKMVPASTLPVDPQGLSYDVDDPQTVDPRDQMNPGLVRITNGEDVFTNISLLDADKQEAIYQTMMLDPRWSKFMLQSGFRRSAYPMYWQVGQLSQDKYPGATVNVPGNGTAGLSTEYLYAPDNSDTLWGRSKFAASSSCGLFQVGHRGKLGFLPTDYYQEVVTPVNDVPDAQRFKVESGINNVPEVSVITCVLPKAHKTIYYYRVFITEEVIFTGLRSAPAIYNNGQMLGLDNFLTGMPYARKPTDDPMLPIMQQFDGNNGGNLP